MTPSTLASTPALEYRLRTPHDRRLRCSYVLAGPRREEHSTTAFTTRLITTSSALDADQTRIRVSVERYVNNTDHKEIASALTTTDLSTLTAFIHWLEGALP